MWSLKFDHFFIGPLTFLFYQIDHLCYIIFTLLAFLTCFIKKSLCDILILRKLRKNSQF